MLVTAELHQFPTFIGRSRAPALEIKTKVPKNFTITEKVPTRVFSWLKAYTSAFTSKTLLRHYAKWALALTMVSRQKLGGRPKVHRRQVGFLPCLGAFSVVEKFRVIFAKVRLKL